jgi:biopolymer transport protein ExbD
VKFRKLRQRRRGRIEVIPMIDVMFFLLATFMLASLTLQNLHSFAVNLPQGRATPLQAAGPVTLTVDKSGAILLNRTAVTLETLPATLRSMLGLNGARATDAKLIVAVDSGAPSGIVVQAMLRAREGGAEHFVLVVAPR